MEIDPLAWNIALTQPGQDKIAKDALKNRGYTVYRPIMPGKRRNRWNGDSARSCSMFPGYLFVLPIRQGWEALRTAPGMVWGERALFMINGRLATIPHNDPAHVGIVQVRELEESLWTVDINGVTTLPRFKPGDRVQVKKGPWIEFCGVIETLDGDARVCMLIELLGRTVRTFVNTAHLVPADIGLDQVGECN